MRSPEDSRSEAGKQIPWRQIGSLFFLYDPRGVLGSLKKCPENSLELTLSAVFLVALGLAQEKPALAVQKRISPPGGNIDQIPGFSCPNPW